MVERKAYAVLMRLAGQFSVVAITGPRQSGKSTLARYAFPDGLIIDEAQKVPEIFDAVKLVVDKGDHTPGKNILTGSSQFRLKQNITDSLAGRIGLLKLLPFSIQELKESGHIQWHSICIMD